MSESYKLSLSHNDLMTLSHSLKDSSKNFKELSREIESIYKKLDWETASKENVYVHVRRASESALRIYTFLNNASKTIHKISKDFNNADRNAANFISKETSLIRRIIRSSGIKTASSNAFTEFMSKLTKVFFGDNKNSTIPVASIPNSPKYFAANSYNLVLASEPIDFDWSKLGVNPFNFSAAKGNTANFFLSTVILIAVTIAKTSNRFSNLGISIIRFIDGGNIYYAVTGETKALQSLGVYLPRAGMHGIAQGAGVSNELIKNIHDNSKQLKIGLRNAEKKYKLKLKKFRKANPGLRDNSKIFKAKRFALTIEILEELETNLDSLHAKLLRARIDLIRKSSKGEFRNILKDLNKNFRIKTILKDIEPALLDDLPKIDMLRPLARFKTTFKAAGKGFVDDLKLLNIWKMIKGIGVEAKAIKGAGSFAKGLSKFCKSSVILTAVGIGIDIAFDVTEDGKKWDDITSDVIVDVAFGVACAAASTFVASVVIGSAIGTCIPIPIVGTLIGAAVGAVVGLAIVLVTEVIKINGKSIKDWTKAGVKAGLNFGVDVGKGIGHKISSGWNRVFGGGNKSEKSHAAAPPIQAYDNQTAGLLPSNSPSAPGTAINFGNNFQYRFATN